MSAATAVVAAEVPVQRARPAKILDIECLRAFAIGFTLIAHYRFLFAEAPSWIVWLDSRLQFWGGVDLFFVISGFVISKNLIPQFRAGGSGFLERTTAVLSFWVRRVYRLLPSSWLWALISLGVVAATQERSIFVQNVYDVMAAFLQVYNFHAYACLLGAATCSHLAVGVYWSLSLEEQYYLFLPVLIAVARERAKWVLLAMAVLAPVLYSVIDHIPSFFRWEGFCVRRAARVDVFESRAVRRR